VGSPHAADLAAARTSGFRTWRTAGTRRELAGILDGAPVDDEALSVRHSLLDAATMRRLGGLGVPVVAWTVNDVARAGALRALGVEGLTTDRLAVLRAASRDAG
jgi:glycerophosphoryl diester phosphodiesterase